jgi:NADPH:quinone reductase-like Zn-dependent oxidoreductase
MIEEKVQEGTLVPRVDSVFPMERAHEAHERMIENKNLGKLIIQIRPELGEGDYGC